MMVGCWLAVSLMIASGFRSSLIAHLTVQTTTEPIETLTDLINQKKWEWSLEPKFFKGAVYNYFTKHTHPVVQEFISKVEVCLFIFFLAISKLTKIVVKINHVQFISYYIVLCFRSWILTTPYERYVVEGILTSVLKHICRSSSLLDTLMTRDGHRTSSAVRILP